jgi:hypothetical protein
MSCGKEWPSGWSLWRLDWHVAHVFRESGGHGEHGEGCGWFPSHEHGRLGHARPDTTLCRMHSKRLHWVTAALRSGDGRQACCCYRSEQYRGHACGSALTGVMWHPVTYASAFCVWFAGCICQIWSIEGYCSSFCKMLI